MSNMLIRGRMEDVASFIERAILQSVGEQAESIHIELKQHYLLIRFQWASRMRTMWRGTRGEGIEAMAFLKTASGMNVEESRVLQEGNLDFAYQGGTVTLPVVCKPYITEEKIVLSLRSLLGVDGRAYDGATDK